MLKSNESRMAEDRHAPDRNSDPEVMLGLLNAVEAGDHVTQRTLAGELGIALGLVNTYLKRCVKKGLIKVQAVPPRRYAYYLTPQGFAEKSRLTANYFSHSLRLFRQARDSFAGALAEAESRGWRRVVLVGASEASEIAALSALDTEIEIVAIYDPGMRRDRFAGVPVCHDLDTLPSDIDGAMLTVLTDVPRWHARALALFEGDRVIVPDFLRGAVQAVSSEAAE